jgi:excisionase family DNA binding protein
LSSQPINLRRPAHTSAPPWREALSVRQFAEVYGLGKSTVYELVDSGQLRAVRCNRRILIPREAAEAWFAGLPEHEPA